MLVDISRYARYIYGRYARYGRYASISIDMIYMDVDMLSLVNMLTIL